MRAVVEAAEAEPEKYERLRDTLDRTGKVDGAFTDDFVCCNRLKRAGVRTAAAAGGEVPSGCWSRTRLGGTRTPYRQPR